MNIIPLVVIASYKSEDCVLGVICWDSIYDTDGYMTVYTMPKYPLCKTLVQFRSLNNKIIQESCKRLSYKNLAYPEAILQGPAR